MPPPPLTFFMNGSRYEPKQQSTCNLLNATISVSIDTKHTRNIGHVSTRGCQEATVSRRCDIRTPHSTHPILCLMARSDNSLIGSTQPCGYCGHDPTTAIVLRSTAFACRTIVCHLRHSERATVNRTATPPERAERVRQSERRRHPQRGIKRHHRSER